MTPRRATRLQSPGDILPNPTLKLEFSLPKQKLSWGGGWSHLALYLCHLKNPEVAQEGLTRRKGVIVELSGDRSSVCDNAVMAEDGKLCCRVHSVPHLLSAVLSPAGAKRPISSRHAGPRGGQAPGQVRRDRVAQPRCLHCAEG